MQLAMLGLGRMGMNMVLRLLEGKHEVIAYNRTPDKVDEVVKSGAIGACTLEEMVQKLKPPRVVWIMLPAGKPVDDHIDQLIKLLSQGDIIIDGGNSYYKEGIARAEKLQKYGIHFLDAGTSGGIWGLKVGYCLMIGGEEEIFKYLEPVFKTLAPPDGYLYCGSHGAGHFVKMVHNGIEYGMLQAYGEGFEILKKSQFNLQLNDIAKVWTHGSVVRSWLLDLLVDALEKDPALSSIKGYVEESGEGRWTVEEAINLKVHAPVIALSLFTRYRSQEAEAFSDKIIAALRHEFGGHAVEKE